VTDSDTWHLPGLAGECYAIAAALDADIRQLFSDITDD
jgi:hypothetical protein